MHSASTNAITLSMSAKRTKGQWVVYEHREGEFVSRSKLYTTRARAQKERDKLEAGLISKQVSLGVGIVAKE